MYKLTKIIALPLIFFISFHGNCQTTIYVAPAPKDYWQQKREDAERNLLYQLILSENAEKNAKESVANALDKAQKCINNVREYYTSLSEYPVIGSGLHDVHIYDGAYICQKTKASVSASGKVNWVGDNKFYDAKSSDVIKNAKTKIIIDIDGKSYFLDVFFIYDK